MNSSKALAAAIVAAFEKLDALEDMTSSSLSALCPAAISEAVYASAAATAASAAASADAFAASKAISAT